MASASTVSEPKQLTQRRKSNDTVCSSNSSCFLHKRKPVNPLANSIRTFVSRSTNSTVKQRVLSARLLKLRSLQNQLNDANFHLAELQQENRALRNLQSRQDRALSRYEGTNADLPKLIRSHEDEIRVLTAKNKTLRKNLKDVSDQLKVKEDELASVRDQLKNLVALTKEKNLGERHVLAEQVEDLKFKLQSSNEKITLLNRKVELETKNSRYKLNGELVKNKQAQKELLHALAEIDRLNSVLEVKGKFMLSHNRKRFANVNQRQSISLVNLTDNKMNKEPQKMREILSETKVSFNLDTLENELDNTSDSSEIKLEPISNNEKEVKPLPSNDIMVSPSENIKARLSASLSTKINIEQLNKSLENLNMLDSDSMEPSHSITLINPKSRPNSSHKLRKLTTSFQLVQKPSDKTQVIEQSFGSLRSEMLSTVKNCGSVVNQHKEDYEFAKSETEKLLDNLRETDAMNSTLRHSEFLTKETYEIPEKDLDLANQIWNDEYGFRKDMKRSKDSCKEYDSLLKSDRNGNVIKKEADVALQDKTKLLAALRAIDNGDDVDEMKYDSGVPNRKNKLVDELLAELHK